LEEKGRDDVSIDRPISRGEVVSERGSRGGKVHADIVLFKASGKRKQSRKPQLVRKMWISKGGRRR